MIASDKTGEVLSFGTTIPHVTVDTPLEHAAMNVAYLVNKMVANHEEYLKTLENDEKAVISIPVPLETTKTTPIHEAQLRCLDIVKVVGEELGAAGYSVLSITPAGLTDDGVDSVRVGYVVTACKGELVHRFLKDGDREEWARTWTDHAFRIYAIPAVERFQSEMYQRFTEGMSDGTQTH